MGNKKAMMVVLITLFLTSILLYSQSPYVHAATIFADDYETGDYSAWTGVYTVNNGKMLITSAAVYNGTYSAQCSLADMYNSTAYAYYTVSAETLYYKQYVKVSSLPPNDTSLNLFGIMDYYLLTHFCTITIDNNDDNYSWKIRYYNNTVEDNVAYFTAVDIKVDTWYYVELMVKSGDGTGQVAAWIAEDPRSIDEASPVINLTNIFNDDLPIGAVFFGSIARFTGGVDIFSDDVVLSNTWAGPMVDLYTVSLSTTQSGIEAGDTVTISVDVTKNNEAYMDFLVNVTKDGELFKQNVTSSFTDLENTAGQHTYAVSSLYDNATDQNVIFTTDPLEVVWSPVPTPTPTPTPSPTPTATPTPTPSPTPTATPTPTPSPTPTATPTPTPTSTPEPAPEELPIEAVIGIVLAIVVVIVAILLLLRNKGMKNSLAKNMKPKK